MSVDFIDCQPADVIGYPTYWRAVFEPGVLSLTNGEFMLDMQQALRTIPASLMVVEINNDAPKPGAETYVCDLRGIPEGKYRTVGELAYELNDAALGTRLRSLEKVSSADVYGSKGTEERAAVQAVSQKEHEQESVLNQLKGKASSTLTALEWAVALGVLLALIVYADKLSSAWKHMTGARS
jgi:hypothetical protein